MITKKITPIVLSLILTTVSSTAFAQKTTNLEKAQETLRSIYAHYTEPNTPLLHENYPVDKDYKASYLADPDKGEKNQFSYLWPLSGVVSGANTLARSSESRKYTAFMKDQMIPALDRYHDTKRKPACYSSYITAVGKSDRFYDDNIWLGIDFIEFYQQTKDKKYLKKAQEIWRFIESGTDDKLGGGIYWCEQKKHGKNTCSNAPGSVLAFKLFEATRDSSYFHQGLALYNWTKSNLQDPSDHLYFDNKNLKGDIGRAKFTYNSGQMLQSAALLYKLTGDKAYLTEAQTIAASCIEFFTYVAKDDQGQSFRLMKSGNLWFTAVMLRGFVELYHQDHDSKYLELFDQNLDYAWNHARDAQGLFSDDWTGNKTSKRKWLLDQGAMVEMYASIANAMGN